MAIYQTYTAIGQREDLSDLIANISPTDTPFMSTVGKGKATATYHEWQTDSLADAALGGAVEGATASSATMSPTSRIGNRTQIFQKTIAVCKHGFQLTAYLTTALQAQAAQLPVPKVLARHLQKPC